MIKQGLVVSAILSGALLQANVAMAEGTIVGKIGTLGAGLEYVHPLNSKLAIGIGVNGMSFDESLTESEIDYDADLNMQSISLLADFHPFENGFRISAGAMQNGNEFSLVGTPVGDETVEVNGNTYTASDVGSLEAFLGFDSLAPYVGIGWGHAPKSGKGWSLDADLGVLFQGEPNASLSATCGTALTAVACSVLTADVALEEQSFISDVADFELLPVVSIGASYTF